MKVMLFVTWVVLSTVGSARAAEFFVVTDTFKSQREAQDRAASVGGWVLDTDAYSALPPNLFAVVRGPYAKRESADHQLRELKSDKSIKTYRAAYVKDAGVLRVAAGLARSVPPKVLTALLGELSVDVIDRPGGTNPCEPSEPYQDVSVSVVTLDRTYDKSKDTDGFKPRRVDLDIGGFWIIKRTGEIERMRVCTE